MISSGGGLFPPLPHLLEQRPRREVVSLARVQSDEACLVQPLPQSHFHLEVMVDVEDHWVVVPVVVVVRVLLVVWGHEAVDAHLHQQNTHTHRVRMKPSQGSGSGLSTLSQVWSAASSITAPVDGR